jgi:hypothetical protein
MYRHRIIEKKGSKFLVQRISMRTTVADIIYWVKDEDLKEFDTLEEAQEYLNDIIFRLEQRKKIFYDK